MRGSSSGIFFLTSPCHPIPCCHPLWPLISCYLKETLHLPRHSGFTAKAQDTQQWWWRQISALVIPVLVFLSDLGLFTLLQQYGGPSPLTSLHNPISSRPQARSAGPKGDKAEVMPAEPRGGGLGSQGSVWCPWLASVVPRTLTRGVVQPLQPPPHLAPLPLPPTCSKHYPPAICIVFFLSNWTFKITKPHAELHYIFIQFSFINMNASV